MDKLAKPLAYVEAVLSFIQCGYAMEQDPMIEQKKISQMYEQTLKLLKWVFGWSGNSKNDTMI